MSVCDPEVAAATDFDVVVIGAGAVGLVLSVTLSRAGKRVLLLESGAEQASLAAQRLNDAEVVGRPHNGVHEGRARVVGGTTTLWGGQLTRFSRSDLRSTGAAGPAWQVGFEEIEHYYAAVARLLGLDVERLSDGSVRADIALSGDTPAQACEIFFTRWLREPNLARYFEADLSVDKGIWLLPEMHVRGFEWDAQASRVTAVVAQDAGGREQAFRGRTFVLANGTIEISRLLQLSARRTPALPWAKNGNVGAFFQDHLDFNVGRIANETKGNVADLFENRVIAGRKYQPKLRLTDAFIRRENTLNVACSMNFESSFAEDLALLKHAVRSVRNGRGTQISWRTLARIAAQVRIWWPLAWRYLRHRRIMAMADRGVSVLAHCEQLPQRDSRIRLHASRVDRFGDPVAELDWKVDAASQVRSLRAFVDEAGKYLRDVCGAKLEPAAFLDQPDEKILSTARDSFHQCGGACMAADESGGVVDGNARIFGSANVHVAGAAIFPSSSFANPTFTAMALALRLAGHLTEAAR